MIKQKFGICPDCHDDKSKPVIAGRCQYHYWKSKSKKPPKASPTRIRPISKSHAKELRIYSKVRKEYLSVNTRCMAGLSDCTGKSTEVHHTAKRGKNLNVVSTFMAVCHSCHMKIEVMAIDESVKRGLRIRYTLA